MPLAFRLGAYLLFLQIEYGIMIRDFYKMDILLETFKVIVPAFLAFVAGRYLKVFDRQKERDKETFDVFLKILPVTGGILYIVENHVSNGLDREGLSDLKNLIRI